MTHARPHDCRDLPLSLLRPSPFNIREDEPEEDLYELASSILEQGLIEPIVVRPVGPGGEGFEIVAGERRFRAARLAERESIPAIIRTDLDDRAAVELTITENLHRRNWDPVTEGRMFQRLLDLGVERAELPRRVKRSAGYVEDRLALLGLPETVQARVRTGELNLTHAKTLCDLAEAPETLERLAGEIAQQKATGKQLREAVNGANAQVNGGPVLPPTLGQLRRSLDRLGKRVHTDSSDVIACAQVAVSLKLETPLLVQFGDLGAGHPLSKQRVKVEALVGRMTAQGITWHCLTGGQQVPFEKIATLLPQPAPKAGANGRS